MQKSNSDEKQPIRIKAICKADDTHKYCYKLIDGKCIETVLIKRKDGATACLSTQVGCPVRCIFCKSGRNGFIRNLSPSEIVQQIYLLQEKVSRIVFMGIGEPLFNYENLIEAIHILRDRSGIDFPTDGITVSTVGPVDQLKKLREEHLKIQLTISLHATNQHDRNTIIPGMRRCDIFEVVASALSYAQRHNRKIVIAYLLLPGINDKPSDAQQLVNWFRGKNVMINLLEYNQTGNSGVTKPSKQEMAEFKHRLEKFGLEVRIRESRGKSINAACGQLAAKYGKAGHRQ
ncbi:MAG: 23S rRNA (adenine(2503)-C(2))-methyltransferase RlmN [Coriobacteriaceae bacterium]|nr:23S rRNA (adenine(2503)-C(2))-methyltransferase RlmN [Coriobacteriaceae bacterium]